MLSPDDAQVLNLFYKGDQTSRGNRKNYAIRSEYSESETSPGETTSKGQVGKTFFS